MSTKATSIGLLGKGAISMRSVHYVWMAILSCVLVHATSLPLITEAHGVSALMSPSMSGRVQHTIIAAAVLALLILAYTPHRPDRLYRASLSRELLRALRHAQHFNISS